MPAGLTCDGSHWSDQYSYYASGNLQHKTDARNITISYTYDALNRLTLKQGPGINYLNVYDSVAWSPNSHNGIGRLIAVTNSGVADKLFSYDVMGRLNWQATGTTSSHNNTGIIMTAAYDLAGNMTDLTYPDGLHLQQAWDGAGHLCNVVTATSGTINCTTNSTYRYFSSPTYFPSGPLSGMTFGNGVTESHSLNNRLQPTEISVQNSSAVPYMDKRYCYGPITALCPTSSPTPNNGNVLDVLNGLDSNRSQGYSYDNLNRIQAFSNGNGSMSQSYNIDSFGNMTVVPPATLLSSVAFDPAESKNRITTTAGYNYDDAGNVIQVPDALLGSQYYNYDAENKLTSVGNPVTASYSYDGDGTRFRKATANGWTEYVYFGGTPVAEKNSTGSWSDYIFANGQRIARVDPTVNLVPYSQQFGSSSWGGYCGPTSNMTSNTADLTAPDGTNTATKFVEPATLLPCGASGVSLGVLTFVPGGLQAGLSYTVSVWLRGASGGENVYFGLNDCAETGVTLTSSWQRYAFTWPTLSSGTASCEGSRGFQVLDLFSPNATYYVWGAQTEQAPSAGPYVATGSSTQTLHYYTSDHLGTTTVITDAAGALQNDSDYYPYGYEVPFATGDVNNHYKFTGKERDTESGNDYFGARYYASNMGRFMSPDWSAKEEPVPYAKLDDPQSLNLYAYVRDNPLSRVDLGGHQNCGAGNANGAGCQFLAQVHAQDATQQHGRAQQNPNRQPDGSYKATPAQLAKVSEAANKKAIIGNGECVTACERFTGVPGPTSSWRGGKPASELTDKDQGTAIATFIQGSDGQWHYLPDTGGHMNSGTYMARSTNGTFWMADQWPQGQKPVSTWNVGSNPNNASMNAGSYRVIIVPNP